MVALCRHASIADALVVGWVLSARAHLKPRFVLKKELSFDPCLDVVGRRVPNYFVDRRAVNTQTEINGIAEMAGDTVSFTVNGQAVTVAGDHPHLL